MRKIIGLSAFCFLCFGNVQADQSEGKNEYSVKSWSMSMEQRGDGPIQVQTERKESNENGIVFYEKTSGTIDEDGKFIENKEEEQPKAQKKQPKHKFGWSLFSRNNEEAAKNSKEATRNNEEVAERNEEAEEETPVIEEHWKRHAREHPNLPPCNQAPRMEAPKRPQLQAGKYPAGKNCWRRLPPPREQIIPADAEDADLNMRRLPPPREQVVPAYAEDEGLNARRFKRRHRRHRVHPNNRPNVGSPRHIVMQYEEPEGRPMPPAEEIRVCPLKNQQHNPMNKSVIPVGSGDPWEFSEDFFKTWQEFDKQFNKHWKEF